jgi:hypothetical protein
MIRFWEVFRCAGVDHDARHPGMVIPFNGSNLVAVQVDKEKARLISDSTALKIDDVDTAEMIRARTAKYRELSEPGTDPKLAKAYMPDDIHATVRYYRITGKRKVDFKAPAKLQVIVDGKRKAEMPVVVVDPVTVKVAIRDLRVYGADRKLKFHSSRPAEVAREMAVVNEIWTPQAQMVFEHVAAPQPAIIDDTDPKIREAIRAGLGQRTTEFSNLGENIDPEKLKALFAPLRASGADVTVFFVEKVIGSDGRSVNGRAISSHAMVFIAANHDHSTLAHELGHFLGGTRKNGEWDGLDHTYDMQYDEKTKKMQMTDEDVRMLMRDGGAGYKIPFNLVEPFRTFKARIGQKAK